MFHSQFGERSFWVLRPPVGNDPPGNPTECRCLDILWIPVGQRVGFVHEADAFEVGGCDAYASAISGVDQSSIVEWLGRCLPEARLGHGSCQHETVATNDPNQIVGIEPV